MNSQTKTSSPEEEKMTDLTEETGKETEDATGDDNLCAVPRGEGSSEEQPCGEELLCEKLSDETGEEEIPAPDPSVAPSTPDASADEKEDERVKARRELASLFTLFPDVKMEEIPEEVLLSPLPLDAAYALYDRKKTLLRERATQKNAENAAMSAGALVDHGGEIYYSPNEVRGMTPSEVRHSYQDILRSMQKWK